VTRAAETAWIAEYLDDVDADFRVFYGIHGVADGSYGGLSGPRFVAMAERLPHYRGAVRDLFLAAAREQEEEGQGPGPAPARGRTRPRAGGQEVREVAPDEASLRADPVLAGVIDFG
jgi:hypothetical protein